MLEQPWALGGAGIKDREALHDRTALRCTNIPIYAHDRDAGVKHDKAKRILTELWNQEYGCLSVQVLQEFFVTKKIPQTLPTAVARADIAA